jgi:hypothetical protein
MAPYIVASANLRSSLGNVFDVNTQAFYKTLDRISKTWKKTICCLA